MRMYSYNRARSPAPSANTSTHETAGSSDLTRAPTIAEVQYTVTEFHTVLSVARRSPAACSLPPRGCRLRVRRHNIYPLP